MERHRRQALFSWLFVGAILALCAVLGVLQYRWIDEASRAERERLRGSLQASLNRLSIGFNTDLTSACAALMSRSVPPDQALAEEDVAAHYQRWRESAPHEQLFSTVALATEAAAGGGIRLRILDPQSGAFHDAAWPASWQAYKTRLEERIADSARERPEPPGRPKEGKGDRGPRFGGGRFVTVALDEGLLIEIPRVGRPPGPGPLERNWLLVEVNADYVRATLLPELLQRHLGTGMADYQIEVVERRNPNTVIFRPAAGAASIASSADAQVALFELQYDQMFRRMAPPMLRDAIRTRTPSTEFGRWLLSVRHRSGSLDAVVAQTRLRNLAVTAAILLLMLATVAALMRFTRRAQRLAELQMDFVAGVSHELRTPLTVIRTAAFNLRGKLAANPAQVEKYGALIQKESERLTDLVEQVLLFARAKAGHALQKSETFAVEEIIEESLASCKPVIDAAACTVQRDVPSGLPLVVGDPVSLKHAVQNLLTNAAKYGAEGGHWIGVSAARADADSIEIRVADRGPGIPPEELANLFDPFFRGRRAIDDQIHGTGLGLNLARSIVEAHGGAISVSSQPGTLTQFTIRIPAAPPEQQDEFANSPR